MSAGQSLIGSVRFDSLAGSVEDDTIDGLAGNDTLTGGAGIDYFIISAGTDTVTDLGNGGQDVLSVNVGASANVAVTDTWVASSATKNLGFTTLRTSGLFVSLSEVIVGNGFRVVNVGVSSKLIGSNLNDTILGGVGDDSIEGRGGNDLLLGGEGLDLFIVDAGSDSIDDLGLGGNDELRVSAGASVNAVVVGNWIPTSKTGNLGTVNIDTRGKLVNLTDAVGNGFNVTNNGLPTTLYGSRSADFLTGGISGDDTIDGGGGNDTIDGRSGNDRLTGGAGVDRFNVTSGTDTVTDLGTGGADVLVVTAGAAVNATVTAAWTATSATRNAGIANLSTSGLAVDLAAVTTGLGFRVTNIGTAAALIGSVFADSLVGGTGDDTLVGNAGNDILIGGSGSNSMMGGTGDDEYLVDSAGDSLIEAASAGTDTVRTSLAAYTLGSDIENLLYTGVAGFAGTGNPLANSITGGVGKDTLDGGAGNDTLDGGAGNDTLVGGAGVDRFNVTSGTDTVTDLGTGGADVLVVTAGAAVNATVTAAWTATSATRNAGIANLSTSGLAVDLAAVTTGLGFRVTNIGTAAALIGSVFADSLVGGTGNDSLIGRAGNDILDGGEGADSMIGGSGDDIYYIDSASDVVVEEAQGGIDTVISAISASLVNLSNVENWLGTGSANINGGGNARANGLTGNVGNNVIGGAAGNDTLTGNDGADTLIGGQGSDTIVLTETTSAADVVVFSGGTGTAGTTARVAKLGLDVISGFDASSDKLQFSAADFGIASGTTVVKGSGGTDGNFYIVTAAPTSTAVDLNGSGVSNNNGAIVFVGATTGTAGVDVWFTTSEGAFRTASSVKIATLVGVNTANIEATDLAFVT